MPQICWWPGRIVAGKVTDQVCITMDLTAACLAAAGVAAAPTYQLDGHDLLPVLTGQAPTSERTLYWRMGAQMAVRQGDWKLVRYDRHADPGQGVSRKTGAAEIVGPKLYNLAQDIGESHDLSAQDPDKVQELKAVWQK